MFLPTRLMHRWKFTRINREGCTEISFCKARRAGSPQNDDNALLMPSWEREFRKGARCPVPGTRRGTRVCGRRSVTTRAAGLDHDRYGLGLRDGAVADPEGDGERRVHRKASRDGRDRVGLGNGFRSHGKGTRSIAPAWRYGRGAGGPRVVGQILVEDHVAVRAVGRQAGRAESQRSGPGPVQVELEIFRSAACGEAGRMARVLI